MPSTCPVIMSINGLVLFTVSIIEMDKLQFKSVSGHFWGCAFQEASMAHDSYPSPSGNLRQTLTTLLSNLIKGIVTPLFVIGTFLGYYGIIHNNLLRFPK